MNSQTYILWNEFKAYCVSELSVDSSVKFYLDSCVPLSLEDGVLMLGTPTKFCYEAISSRFLLEMRRLFAETGLGKDILLTIETEQKETPVQQTVQLPAVKSKLDGTGLNSDYVFDTFIVGKSNRMPHAACLAVAEQPGSGYNPLFIWGNVGLGKTHLMQAIGHFVLDKDPSKKVLYVSADTFTNDLIHSIRTNSMEKFRQRYRELDLLMIDDIQFISGKESTQEEFFNTFNALHIAKKQIVLSSDRPPKETGLEDRLISRFSSGLVTDIQTPDYETRVSILQNKAERKNMSVPEDVINYIAENIPSNIRELEGALNRVRSISEINGEPLTLEKTCVWLKDLLREHSHGPVTINQIQQLTADAFGFSLDELLSKKRTADIALARHVAMFIAREKTDESLQQIGLCFNKKDHTTVFHACNKIESLIKSDGRVKMIVDNVVKKL